MPDQKIINQIEPWYDEEEKRAIAKYLDSGGWIMEFKKTREFEQMICDFTKAKYCSVVTNGTVSLFAALQALGIGRGGEVIVPDYTMIATPNAVLLTGASVVLVDIDPTTMCVDLPLVKKAVTPKTKAVLHVSINGRAGDLEGLRKLCIEKGIALIEDAAQAFGSFYNKKHLGTIGQIGSFSFSVPKIITTGQGGAVVTDDKTLYERVCKIKDFGRLQGGNDIHDNFGWNFKFTDLQAVFGIEQIKKMKLRMENKKRIYKTYLKLLGDLKQVRFLETDLSQVTPWFIDIFVDEPDKLFKYLKNKKIGSRRIYPPIHSQKIYSGDDKDFRNSTKMCDKGLWLPSSSFLTDKDIKRVCNEIKDFYYK